MKTPPFDLAIPRYWEPPEALAVYELLEELTELIWSQYEIPLLELLAEQRCIRQCAAKLRDGAQLDLFDPGESIPF
jgi:hypothetical protein